MIEQLPSGWTRIADAGFGFGPTVMLDDGRLLRITNENATLYDPARDTWEPTGPMVGQGADQRSAVAMAEGWVLVSGGAIGGEPIAECELYDPKRNAWLAMPALPERRCRHASVVARGRAFVIGGVTKEGRWRTFPELTTVWSWAPGETAWKAMPALPFAIESAKALVLDDDSVVVWGYAKDSLWWNHEQWHPLDAIDAWSAVAPLAGGGLISAGGSSGDEAVATVRTWTPAGGWQPRGELPGPRKQARAVRLADHRIAIVGGSWTTKSWEDTSTGGELDYEYRSFMAWVVNNYDCRDALVETGDGWLAVPAPAGFGLSLHALPDGRVIVDDRYAWRP